MANDKAIAGIARDPSSELYGVLYRPTKAWLGAPSLIDSTSGGGTPTLVSNGWNKVWQIGTVGSGQVGVTGSIQLPLDWKTFTIDVWWVNLGTGAGVVKLHPYVTWFSPDQPTNNTQTSASGVATVRNGPAVTATALAQNLVTKTTLMTVTSPFTGIPVNPYPYQVTVARSFDGADTLANAIGIQGIQFTRTA